MRPWFLLAAVVLAGCLGDSSPPADAHDMATGDDELAENQTIEELVPIVELTACEEAAGISVYDLETYRPYGPPAPWVTADMSDEIGNPVFGSFGNAAPVLPVTASGAAGHWHTSVVCEEMNWGWVGIMVERPAWDADGPERQLLLAAFSMPEGHAFHQLHAAGFHMGKTLQSFIDWPEGTLHHLLSDDDHGTYETQAVMRDLATAEARTTRVWMQTPVDGATHEAGPWRPVAVDFIDSPSQHLVSVDSTAFFSHTDTSMHAPLPGAYGNTAAAAFTDFDRTIWPGPTPDVVLASVWIH